MIYTKEMGNENGATDPMMTMGWSEGEEKSGFTVQRIKYKRTVNRTEDVFVADYYVYSGCPV